MLGAATPEAYENYLGSPRPGSFVVHEATNLTLQPVTCVAAKAFLGDQISGGGARTLAVLAIAPISHAAPTPTPHSADAVD